MMPIALLECRARRKALTHEEGSPSPPPRLMAQLCVARGTWPLQMRRAESLALAQPPTRACVGLPARNRLARSRTVPLERCGFRRPLSVTDGAVTACFALHTAAKASKAGQDMGATIGTTLAYFTHAKE
eukprot:scaffold79996_cov93-Phaeocystis_antarctica.AAC.1